MCAGRRHLTSGNKTWPLKQPRNQASFLLIRTSPRDQVLLTSEQPWNQDSFLQLLKIAKGKVVFSGGGQKERGLGTASLGTR